jgi:hypothetical protein
MINSVRLNDKAIRVFDLMTKEGTSNTPIHAHLGAPVLLAKLQHTAQ